MKKVIFILLFFTLVVGGVFAQGLTYGIGLLFDGSWENGVRGSFSGIDIYSGTDNNSFGGFAYLDYTYVEICLNLSFGSVDFTTKMSGLGADVSESKKLGDTGQIGISLLGKYPISLGSITFFPLAGISYNMFIFLEDGNTRYSDPEILDQFGVLAGIGADIIIGGSLYMRVEGLFQLRFTSKFQRDLANEYKANPIFKHFDFNPTFGMGPVIKVAFGSMI